MQVPFQTTGNWPHGSGAAVPSGTTGAQALNAMRGPNAGGEAMSSGLHGATGPATLTAMVGMTMRTPATPSIATRVDNSWQIQSPGTMPKTASYVTQIRNNGVNLALQSPFRNSTGAARVSRADIEHIVSVIGNFGLPGVSVNKQNGQYQQRSSTAETAAILQRICNRALGEAAQRDNGDGDRSGGCGGSFRPTAPGRSYVQWERCL